MKKNIAFRIAFIIVLMSNYGNVVAQTNIPHGYVNGTWKVSGSPYLIQGNIMVSNDSTLTIEPGVNVIFQGAYKFYVQGRIIAIGTKSDTISFKSADAIYGWSGLRFDNTPVNNDTTKLSYCKFLYGSAAGNTPDDNGGALYFNNSSKVIIENCLISKCQAYTFGGGICSIRSNPIITNCTIINCTSARGGGIYCYKSSAMITSNTISNNKSGLGAGIYCENSFSIIRSNLISYNFSPGEGRGICSLDDRSTIDNNKICFNTTSNSNNLADGGGIMCLYGNPTISNNTIFNNSSDSFGGGIHSQPAIVINNTIFNNSSGFGGGIYNAEGGQVSYNTIYNNHALQYGGGILTGGVGQINNNKINNNSALIGGGIGSYGDGQITNNEISNNSADFGGGISNSAGTSIITGNVICNNTATANGGGILCHENCKTKFTNNTISNNDANNGGALYCDKNSDPDFHNTIIYNNTANDSGPEVFLKTEDCDPNFYYCDVQGGMNAFEINGNFYTGIYQNNIDSNPLFVSPSSGSGINFNGVTADWSLQKNSPCINKGNPGGTYPQTDITGNPRIYSSIIDVGAYEFQEFSSTIEQISKNRFIFYPNPAHDRIEISGSDCGIVELIDIQGLIVKSFNILNAKTTVDISKLSDGVYLIKITNDKGITVKKLIKQ